MGAAISAKHTKAECDELRLENAHIKLMPAMANETIRRTAMGFQTQDLTFGAKSMNMNSTTTISANNKPNYDSVEAC